MLFEGSTCRMHDDWKLHNRNAIPMSSGSKGCMAMTEVMICLQLQSPEERPDP